MDLDDDEEGEPLIWVCRDLPGDHVGGPECFCRPRAFTADELPQSDEELSLYNKVN